MPYATVGWADFVDWLGGSGEAQALAAFTSLLVAIILVLVTFGYLLTTRRMVREMRDQRMAEDEPLLLLRIVHQKLADYHEWDDQDQALRHKQTGEEVKPWPLPDCTVRMHNDGRGTAVNVEVCYLQAQNYYFHSIQPFLRQRDSEEVNLSGFPAFYGGRSSWEKAVLKRWGAPMPGGVAAHYEDVHGRSWVSYLDLDWDPSMTPYIVPLKQRRLLLDEHP